MRDRPPMLVHLERGLRRHFDDMLRQPVPPRLNELLCRLKAEEAFRAENGGPWREIILTSLDPSDSG